MKKGKIIIVSGPSGVGKGTVNKALLLEKDLKLAPSVSATSRDPRPGEVDGVNYHFISKEEFEEHINNGDFLEYAEFIGNYYGTLRSEVYKKIEEGINVVLEIEVVGANKVISNEDPNNFVSIFLIPPSLKHLENRLRGRGTESEDIIRKRLNKALLEIPLKHNYQYAVILDTIENTIKKISDILLKENCLEQDKSESYYYRMEEIIKGIIVSKYMYFIENWKENVRSMNIKMPENLILFDMVVELLAKRIYRFVLENKDFDLLKDKEFIDKYVEKFILDINFYSLDQSGFLENNDF